MKNTMIKNAVILTAITLVAGVCLGFVYEITKAPIAVAKEEAKQNAYREVFVAASEFTSVEGFVEEQMTSGIVNEVVVASDGTTNLGYVITVTNPEGYGGDITLTMGVTNEGVVNGISFLTLAETPGLGMNANTDEFKNQYAEKQVDAFEVTKTGATSDNQIDVISGATITTDAITQGVNAGLEYFNNHFGGGLDE